MDGEGPVKSGQLEDRAETVPLNEWTNVAYKEVNGCRQSRDPHMRRARGSAGVKVTVRPGEIEGGQNAAVGRECWW